MTNQSLYSAQEEPYTLHIDRCLERFEVVYPVFEDTLKRIFHIPDSGKIKEEIRQMVLFHDLGKLTKRWQENLGKGPLPPHAPVGAAYLWKSMSYITDLRKSIVFAVAIHHTDSGLLGDNIEKPDVQAILKGIVDFAGEIIWDKRVYKLSHIYFPPSAHKLTVYDLKDMARGLRLWARGGSIREQHKKRLQATLSHHILKLCDISAATERKEYQKKDEQDYYGGWLMVDNIKDYVDGLEQRWMQ